MSEVAVWFDKPLNDGDWVDSFSIGTGWEAVAGGARRVAQPTGCNFTLGGNDSLRAAMVQHLGLGTVFASVWFSLYRKKSSNLYFLEYEFKQVLVSSCQLSKNSFAVGLDFEKMSYRLYEGAD